MSFTIVGQVGWWDDFVIVDCMLPIDVVLHMIRSAPAPWIVLRRHQGLYLYAFSPEELLNWPPLRDGLAAGIIDLSAPLDTVLGLHEEHSSTQTDNRSAPPPIDRGWRSEAHAPSIERYIEVDADHTPKAVGSMILAAPPQSRPRVRSAPSRAGKGGRATRVRTAMGEPKPVTARIAVPPAMDRAAPAVKFVPPPFEDEGTAPVRQPSIGTDKPLSPGAEIEVTVDLLREAVEHTQGGPVTVGTLAADWTTLDLAVYLQCPALEFPAGTQSSVTIRRNQASIPATIKARVRPDAPAGVVAVMATFLLGTRFCGSAVRLFEIGAAMRKATPEARAGTVVIEPKAVPPDVTVHISTIDKKRPGRQRWLVVTERFEGLPPGLEEDIDLGRDPGAEASKLFQDFAELTRGQHAQRIEGFGSDLWARAPAMFRSVYWALWDRYRRPLTIQFISDEPHMPWELMRPVRPDESELHPPLALKHAVARWIKRWDGYMRNQLPAGRICTIAPKYPSVSRALQRAQVEADKLVADFAARREAGTHAAVLKLLETAPPSEPVAILHFAGHGTFSPQAASHSSIKLEDGELAAGDIKRPEVKLGIACRTVVFFNACEAGRAGAVFGEVGGWADAFLERKFGGFIAPLWSVDDEDAGVVAAELLDRICKQHQPIGEALRAVREKHGAASPTFYSYLYYGDVTARIAA